VLVLEMIEILPSLKKYKYDTWRIVLVKCYIDNSTRLQSYIRNVNNLVLFVRPNAPDLQLIQSIFTMFEGASGLGCNLAKCQLTSIQCDEGQFQLALNSFPYQ
jgi:hypothetical protein